MVTDFTNLILLDIDGLRHDVLQEALALGKVPNIARLLGGSDLSHGLLMPVTAPAPSITFCSQASLFTGTHPKAHGIPGNQFFDRFGKYGDGTPRHYAFDVGDQLAVDDAVGVYTHGLAAKCLQVPTVYERLSYKGWRSVVAGNMYATGADRWVKPSLVDLARFTKGGNLLGLSASEFDKRTLQSTLDELESGGVPEILTFYFLGLDSTSHKKGPKAQLNYLAEELDPKIGRLWNAISSNPTFRNPLVALFSDHGQIEVIPDKRHSLRLSFPFERELGHLFDALGLDVHDYPGEDPHCDAVVASNGGTAYVYLQNTTEHWYDPPQFERDVIPVAKAFWEADLEGKYADEMKDSIAGILIRNVERGGWDAPYQAFTPEGEVVELEAWFSQNPMTDNPISDDRFVTSRTSATGHRLPELYLDPINRIHNLTGPMVGDLLLISNYAEGFYFGPIVTGVHGGLHPEDSTGVLAYGFPGQDTETTAALQTRIQTAIETRCSHEDGRHPGVVDMVTGLLSVL
ncbi:MAG: alkaline phosphatase family protein [Chloroflexota bacterium]